MPSQIEIFDFWISPLGLFATFCIPLAGLHVAAFLAHSKSFAWFTLGIAMFFAAISTISIEMAIGASPLLWFLAVLILYTGLTVGWTRGWRTQNRMK
jgi:uncharacterized membrane protein YczE